MKFDNFSGCYWQNAYLSFKKENLDLLDRKRGKFRIGELFSIMVFLGLLET